MSGAGVAPDATLAAFLDASRHRAEACLDAILPPAVDPSAPLHEAMRYAVFSGGKRLRPALAFATALACGTEPDRVCAVAAATELVHAYSLVHDDLPAMDDDRERRGQPTVHVRYGEATAILVGDALLSAAFGCLAAADVPADVVARLARAAGSRALVGGQADDLAFRPEAATLAEITSIHERKTAAMFGFSVWGAARLAGASQLELEDLERFALHYGLGFQLLDDLADAGSSECSALAVLSRDQARERARELVGSAIASLARFGEKAAMLRALGESLLP